MKTSKLVLSIFLCSLFLGSIISMLPSFVKAGSTPPEGICSLLDVCYMNIECRVDPIKCKDKPAHLALFKVYYYQHYPNEPCHAECMKIYSCVPDDYPCIE